MGAAEQRGGSDSAAAPMPYRSGIDGVRAIGLVAVLLYHADVSWMPAGFLGVDVFFVVSGYLITSLLTAEWRDSGQIGLRAFWTRRARRLLPALFVLLVAVTAIGPIVARDSVVALRGDVVPAIAYVSNWWQIVHRQSYFSVIGRPPLLRHVWSLAVEEQFYLLFPPALVLGLRLARGRIRLIGLAAAALGALSTLAMAVMWHPNADPSRIYYGTDTRAVGLCVGVALALFVPAHRLDPQVRPARRWLIDAIGAAGLVALVFLMVHLSEFSAELYRGGFALTAIAAAGLVIAAAHPATRMSRLLAVPGLRWLGTRSYGIYLWHWPVFMVTRPRLDVSLTGWRLLAVRLGVVFVLAELSWRLVEQPFRSGAAGRAWMRWPRPARLRILTGGVGAAATVATILALVAPPAPPTLLVGATTATTLASVPDVGVAASQPTVTIPIIPQATPAAAPALASRPLTTAATARPAAPAPPRVNRPVTGPATGPPPTRAPARAPVAAPAPAGPIALPAGQVLAVGDSVMLAGKAALIDALGGRVTVDAAVGRQVDAGLDVLQRYRDQGALTRVAAVVIDLGTNGPMSSGQFNRLGGIVADVPRVVLVNVRVPRRWEAESNSSIDNGVASHPGWRLADWHSVSGGAGVLGSDGVHPTPTGARLYARVIAQQLSGAGSPAPPPASAPAPPPPPTPPAVAPPPTTAPPTTAAPTTTTAPPTTAPATTTTTSTSVPRPTSTTAPAGP